MKGLAINRAINTAIVSELVSSYSRSQGAGGANGNSIFKDTACGESLLSEVHPRLIRRYLTVLCIISALVTIFSAALYGIAVCATGVIAGIFYLKHIKHAKRCAIERDLPALLTSVASSVRAGIDPLRAISDADQYFAATSPFVVELKIFKQRLAAGEDEVVALEGLFSAHYHPDIELFKRCIILSRRHGSSLSDPLHRIVRVVRQRQSFRRKTRAALAMHRMSAIGIAMCAGLIAIMQVVMNPKGIALAFSKTAGVVLLSLGGALILVGVVWMLAMGREERL
jgi:Flp pilus assembly protein TadB